MNAFVSPLPTSLQTAQHKSTDFCGRQRFAPQTSRRRRTNRTTIVSRIRRGYRPDPVMPATLFESEPIHDVDFGKFDFSTLRGKVTLILNVACDDADFTDSTYKLLANLLEKYHSAGFEVLAFPSNWYGQSETRTHEQIKEFVHTNYSDKIKIMAKTDLEWNQAFAFGKKYFPGEIIWNFHGKFLFGKTGLPVGRFDLLTTHEYLQSEINRFVHSTDMSIHHTLPADPNSEAGSEDFAFLRGREGYVEEEIVEEDIKEEVVEEEIQEEAKIVDEDEDESDGEIVSEDVDEDDEIEEDIKDETEDDPARRRDSDVANVADVDIGDDKEIPDEEIEVDDPVLAAEVKLEDDVDEEEDGK